VLFHQDDELGKQKMKEEEEQGNVTV